MKRLLLPLAVVAAVAFSTAPAYAYLTSSGSKVASANVGTMQTVTVDATAATPATPLLPGKAGDAVFKVTNPNSSSVTIVSVVGNGSITVTGGSGCTAINAGVTFSNPTSLNIAVPANSSGRTVDLPGAVSMASSSASGCQGANFSIPIVVTAHQR